MNVRPIGENDGKRLKSYHAWKLLVKVIVLLPAVGTAGGRFQ